MIAALVDFFAVLPILLSLSGTYAPSLKIDRTTQFNQLVVSPEFSLIKAHARIESGNRINVTYGDIAIYSGATVTKVDGPGEIKLLDSEYYWFWNPRHGDAGKSFTVTVRAIRQDSVGHTNTAFAEFEVRVMRIQFAVLQTSH